MKKIFNKISSLAIVGLLLFTGCLDILGSEEALGSNSNPIAVVTVVSGQKVVDLGVPIQFDASGSTDSDGTIASYSWNFGDGTTGTSEKAVHKYLYPGNYIVSLYVTDDKGAGGTNDVRLTYITVLHPEVSESSKTPHALISSRASVVSSGSEVELSGDGSWAWYCEEDEDTGETSCSASNNEITKWEWDFGDGQTDTGNATSHIFGTSGTLSSYSSSGSYFVKLTVTNSDGLTDVTGHTIRVLPDEVSGQSSPDPEVFTTISSGEARTLDPAEAYDSASGQILSNTYETLVFYDRDSVKNLIPVLAEEIPTEENGGISPDGLTYTFKIRQGVKFHDKTPMTADDVVFSINRLITMDLTSGPAWMYTELLDKTDEDGDGIADSIVQIDQYTVQFNLNQSAPRFLPILAYTGASIISKNWVVSKGCGTPMPGVECKAIQEEVMGTGPYMLNEETGGRWVHEQYIFMKYHPGYWRGWDDSSREGYGANTDGSYIKEVLIKKNNDQSSRILELLSGSADMVSVYPQYRKDVEGQEGIDYIPYLDSLSMGFIGFNHNIAQYEETAPSADFFTNKDIRKAFCYSFNYDQFITKIKDGYGFQPTGPIPKGFTGYNPSGPKYSYDLDMAEMHFKEAGVWESGFTIKAYYNTGNIDRENGLLMLENSIESLGPQFDIVVEGLEWPTYLDKYYAKEMSLFFLGWGPDYADPHNYAHPFLHSDGHYPHTLDFSNSEIDDIIMEAASEPNSDMRTDLYHELAELEHEEAYFIWTHQAISYHFERDWINGWYSNTMHSTLFYMISKT